MVQITFETMSESDHSKIWYFLKEILCKALTIIIMLVFHTAQRESKVNKVLTKN